MNRIVGVLVNAFLITLFVSSNTHAAPREFDPAKVIVQNDESNPVPVVIQSEQSEEVVLLRIGYTVPSGKRLINDDISVKCFVESDNFGDDFRKYGASATAIFRVFYPDDESLCPEDLSFNACPTQDYVVGSGQVNGVRGLYGVDGSRVGTSIGAGRRMAAVAYQEATLSAFCTGSTNINLINSSVSARAPGSMSRASSPSPSIRPFMLLRRVFRRWAKAA